MISPLFHAALSGPAKPSCSKPFFTRAINWPALCVLAGASLLAAEPLLWLLRSWVAPAYNSQGEWLALLWLGLLLWSISSPMAGPADRRRGIALLIVTAVIRLIGQRLAINTVSAVALVIDAYAIALLLGTAQRQRAVSPGWLALFFACSLPLEHLLQRIGGYGLQQLSTTLACSGLQLFSSDLICGSDRIALGGKELLVDLPCSGARGLLAMAATFLAIAALRRPTAKQAALGMVIAVVGAVVANALRLAAIALLWANPIAEINVMAEPWHGLIGTAAIALSLLPLIIWARQLPARPHTEKPPVTHSLKSDSHRTALAAPLFPVLALAVLFTPGKPLDIAPVERKASLPYRISGLPLNEGSLSPLETQYFDQWGGGARRGYYGPYTLLTVSTRAPLRHLHNPAACLGGNGNTLTYLGRRSAGLPSAEYHLTDRHGGEWQVLVSYVSGDSTARETPRLWATDVATVSWHWLRSVLSRQPQRWTMLQRIAPINHAGSQSFQQFNQSLVGAFDLPQPSQQSSFQTPAALALRD